MKAAVLEALERLVVKEVPTPAPGDDEVLVRVSACAVCGSDIRMFHHGNNRLTPPAIMGHEAAGVVESVGKNVHKFRAGDRVALGGDVPCGECEYCVAGMGNNCAINYAMGYQFPGSFAEYVLLNAMVVNHGPVSKVPDHVSMEEAALAEPLACCINALEMCAPKLGDSMVVIGAGPLGILLTELGTLLGVAKTIVVNRSRPRLDIARQYGVDVTICSSDEDAIARVREETKGQGADIILTACPAPEAQADAIHMARNRARINLFGGLPKGKSIVPIDTNILHYKEIYLFGSHGALPRHHQQAVEIIASGRIDMKKYISHRFPLSQAPDAFAAAEGKAGMRVVVTP
ncbi:MAG: sorbitol dehydrogenase [Candidatus Hydrogenedentota bacterium]